MHSPTFPPETLAHRGAAASPRTLGGPTAPGWDRGSLRARAAPRTVLDLQAHCHVGNPKVRSTENLPEPRCSSFLSHQSWATLIIFRMGQKKSCWRCPSRTGASRRVFLWWIHSTAFELVPQQQCSSLGAPLPDQFAFLEANLQCLRPCGHKQSLAELRSSHGISRAAPFPERRCKT